MRFPTRNPNPVTGPFLEYVSITRSDALTKAGRRNLNLKLWIWLNSQCVELTIRTVHRQWVGRAILHPLCRAIEGPSLVCGAFLAAELDRRDFFLGTSPSRLPVVPGYIPSLVKTNTHWRGGRLQGG